MILPDILENVRGGRFNFSPIHKQGNNIIPLVWNH